MRVDHLVVGAHDVPDLVGNIADFLRVLIGTIRRECLDHVLIFGERHLRRVLTLYALYYNETHTYLGPRTHRDDGLSNDAEGLSQRQFCLDCTITTPGYDLVGHASPPVAVRSGR